MKKIKRFAAVVTAVAAFCSGCSIGGKEVVFDVNTSSRHTVFSVNKSKCSLKEAMIYLCNYRGIYGYEYGVDLFETKDAKELEEYIKDITVDELTRLYCMLAIADKKDIKLTQKELEQASEATQEYYDTLSEEEIDFMNVSESDIAEAYENYARASKLYDLLTQNVNTEVSDDDARIVHINQIYTTSQESAAAVEQRIEAGENFVSIAGQYNEAATVETFVSKGKLPPEVESVAFELENGEVSGSIKTTDGYYFIQCVSKLDQEKTDENKINILKQREQEQFNEDYKGFVEDAKFSLNTQLWDEIKISDEDYIKTNSFFEIYEKHFVK